MAEQRTLTLQRGASLTESEFGVLQSLSRSAAASGLYGGIGNEQKILMILLAAREMGIGPMMALNGGMWNIQGKIELSARLMTYLIRRAGHSLIVKTINDNECVLEGTRKDNGDCCTASFTIQEAQKAGLIRSGSNWIKYPQDMLYARALSRLGRRLFADVIGNAYVSGEIREVQAEVIVEPVRDILLAQEEIDEFISSFGEEKEDMQRYIEVVAEFKKWDVVKTVAELKRDLNFTYQKFQNWKSRQKPPQEQAL